VGDERRRAILRLLCDADGETLGIDTLAERFVNGRPSTEDSSRQVRIELRHIHLPKLAECGLVRYDDETGDVEDATDESDRKLLSAVESYDPDE
jgi:hypothetical protein